MRRLLVGGAALILIGVAAFWGVTAPARVTSGEFDGISGEAAAGEVIFWAGGCAACHSAPDAEGAARLVLSGGRSFATAFGTFRAPNISSDPVAGIGGWSVTDLGRAMQRGVSPEGAHYYPAFPYTSYVKAAPQDIANLHAFLQTLPAASDPSLPHDVPFPVSIRRAVGAWKQLYFSEDWALPGELAEDVARGRYLVEALGHCGECHTPRTMLGGPDRSRWLAGAEHPSGEGRIPNITPGALDWSAADIAEYLRSGFTPSYDVVGGDMAEVVENTKELSDGDRAAIAAYLKAVPAVD